MFFIMKCSAFLYSIQFIEILFYNNKIPLQIANGFLQFHGALIYRIHVNNVVANVYHLLSFSKKIFFVFFKKKIDMII